MAGSALSVPFMPSSPEFQLSLHFAKGAQTKVGVAEAAARHGSTS